MMQKWENEKHCLTVEVPVMLTCSKTEFVSNLLGNSDS